jgi:hypothetical protein
VSLSGNRTFVGFGFGAIQAGLFLYEAFRSGNFRRLMVAEVMPKAVMALRQSAGQYAVNVAYYDRVEAVEIGPVEIANPEDECDRELLAAAVAEAAEIATALPSVAYYTSDSACTGSWPRVSGGRPLRAARQQSSMRPRITTTLPKSWKRRS